MFAFVLALALSILLGLIFVSVRILFILPRRQLSPPTSISQSDRIVELTPPEKSHVLFVLGSGGHTAEMFSMIQDLTSETVTHRTYVFSSGDTHSALKARTFEEKVIGARRGGPDYRLIELPRARRVKQSWLTTPWTCLVCLRTCLDVMAGKDIVTSASPKMDQWAGKEFPDVVVCNGPGTAVMVVLACYIFKFLGLCNTRVVYIESFARVTTLSLSGKLLLHLSHRFLVQWPQLAEKYPSAEHIGFLVS